MSDYDGRSAYDWAMISRAATKELAAKAEKEIERVRKEANKEIDRLRDTLTATETALRDCAVRLPTSTANVVQHSELQSLHRRVIQLLGLPEPGEFVTSDYWLNVAAARSVVSADPPEEDE